MNKPENAQLPPTTRRFRGRDILMILGFLLLALGPIVSLNFRAEMARWKIAKAQELVLQNRYGGAEEVIDQINFDAIEERPYELLAVAKVLNDIGQYEQANVVCEQILDSGFLKEAQPNLIVNFTEVQTTSLNALGREQEALEFVRRRYRLLPDYPPQPEYRKNHLAYQRALAGKSLGAAKRGALELVSDAPIESADELKDGWSILPFEVRSLVAVAVVASKIERPVRVHPDEQVLNVLEVELSKKQERLNGTWFELLSSSYRAMKNRVPFRVRTNKDLLANRIEEERLIRSVAMLRLAGSLIHQKNGDENLRQQWLQEVMQLGFDPAELAKQLPGVLDCLSVIQRTSAFSDTLGLVLLRLDERSESKKQLDLAVVCGEYAFQAEMSSVQNRLGNYYRDPRELEREEKRRLAAVYSHRKQLHQLLLNMSEAQQDAKRIEELGFTERDVLF